jgi:hypothetical protein
MDITFTAHPDGVNHLLSMLRRSIKDARVVSDLLANDREAIRRYGKILGEADRANAKRMMADNREQQKENDAIIETLASLYRATAKCSTFNDEFIKRMCKELGIGPAR